MIVRKLRDKIKLDLKFNKAIIILGARQVGKTTLLNSLGLKKNDTIFIDGDDPESRGLLYGAGLISLERYFKNYNVIVIDEAQLIPEIGSSIKLMVDKLNDKKILISGSSSLELANSINEPLTGRKLEHQLFPLSFEEMVNHHGLFKEKKLLNFRLIYGYYPEIVINPGNEIKLLKNLAGSYLYKDILSFGQIKKPIILDKLLKLLAYQIGSEVSYNELSNNLGVDKETVERYIDLLEKAFVIFRLNALSRNQRTEIKKGKKIFFYDNGIRNALIGNFANWQQRTDKGALWENFIISERIKKMNYDDFYGHHYFWRTTQQQEVDLVEEFDGVYRTFEFKLNPKKTSKLSLSFKNKYDVIKHYSINPNNFEDILL